MQLLLDSADETEIARWLGQGVIDGVTTNPSVLLRDGVTDAGAHLARLAKLVRPGALHAEVTEAGGDELVQQGLRLRQIADNIVVKVPVITPHGEPCLAEISALTRAGSPVNCTACLSLGQAVLAAKAGAAYLSILVGRIDDEGGDGAAVIAECRRFLDAWSMDAKLVAASIRGPADARRAMIAGAHCVTAPPSVLARLADHKYSRHTVRQFLDDARAVEGA